MLSDTKKEYFKKLLSQMLDEVLTVDSRSMDEPDGSGITHSDPSDRAIAELGSTFSLRMQERKGGLIRKIEKALERIEDGTYGICEECEKVISEKRLKARPVTTLCIECKREQEEYERSREL
jgi:DnaK suppressor protein